MKGWESDPRVKAALAAQGADGGAPDLVDPIGQPWATTPLAFASIGDPVAWARAIPKSGAAFNTPKYREAKKAMRGIITAAMLESGWRKVSGPVVMMVLAVKMPPKRLVAALGHNPAAAGVRDHMPTSTPDIDNLAKLVLDAASGLVFGDDAQVTDVLALKRHGVRPYTAAAIAPTMFDGLASDQVPAIDELLQATWSAARAEMRRHDRTDVRAMLDKAVR